MTDLSKLTSPEAAACFQPRSIVIVPIGSTEPHGPHLPLDTDVTIALAQARRAAELLRERGVPAFVAPPIAYGVTNYTEGFPGRVSLRPGTLWALVEDVLRALEQEGVRQIVLVNGHLEPAHVEVLRGVVLDHAVRSEQRAEAVLVDVTRRKNAARLGAEFQSGDCHAGSYETSLVQHADPTAVRERERATLPPVKIDLIAKMKQGITTFAAAGATQAYCGAPREANAETGRALTETLAHLVVEEAQERWPTLFPDRGAERNQNS